MKDYNMEFQLKHNWGCGRFFQPLMIVHVTKDNILKFSLVGIFQVGIELRPSNSSSYAASHIDL